MSEGAMSQVTVKVTIVELRHLVGLAGPGAAFSACAATHVRGDAVETPAMPLSLEPGVHKFEHTQSFTFDHTPLLINELIAQPLALRVSQVEAKSGDMTLLATGELLLDELLRGTRMETLVPLVAVLAPPAPVEGEEPALSPMLLVVIELSAPLVDADELDPDDGGLRVLELRLDGLRSLPARWLVEAGQPTDAHPYAYKVSAAVPLGDGAEYMVTFYDGLLARPGGDATAPAADESIPAKPTEHAEAEGGEQRVLWPAPPAVSPARCILPAASAEFLKQALDGGALLRLHFERSFPPSEEEVAAVADSVGKDEKKGKDKAAADKGAAKGGAKGKGAPAPTELPTEPPELPHPYEVAGTTLLLLASTDRPLFARPPPPPPPVPSVAQLVPKRVLPSLQPKVANKEFETQLSS
ncbi:hypothetical protein T492DRAFT_850811 [Pavlovales sp. CCMP2436]|nr:hypothetical protein T492DRAFT_850811 [Pavlovales sp. CCMP2436]